MFELKKMTIADEVRIKAHPSAAFIEKFASLAVSPFEKATSHWIVDDENNSFLMKLKDWEAPDPQFLFLFGAGDARAVIRISGFGPLHVNVVAIWDGEEISTPDLYTMLRRAVSAGGWFFWGEKPSDQIELSLPEE